MRRRYATMFLMSSFSALCYRSLYIAALKICVWRSELGTERQYSWKVRAPASTTQEDNSKLFDKVVNLRFRRITRRDGYFGLLNRIRLREDEANLPFSQPCISYTPASSLAAGIMLHVGVAWLFVVRPGFASVDRMINCLGACPIRGALTFADTWLCRILRIAKQCPAERQFSRVRLHSSGSADGHLSARSVINPVAY